MTREVARREIESLDYYLQNHTDDYSEESHTAMMMAISALSAEREYLTKNYTNEVLYQETVKEIRELRKENKELRDRLGSFPDREKGEWIITYPNGKHNPIYECPKCKASNNAVFKNFCPNCGADMRGKKE